jgi:hypothetical protein
VAEGDDATGHSVADFVDSGADWRFNVIAALGIGKSLPSAPSLNHENNLSISSSLQKAAPRTRQLIIGSVRSTGPVDNRAIEAGIWRASSYLR